MELTLERRRPITSSSQTISSDASLFTAPVWERFAAIAAHELRTPLTLQRSLLELALGGPNTEETAWRRVGENVLNACAQQERLLDACLTLARASHSVQRSERSDLAAIAADALQAHDLGDLDAVVVLEPALTTGDPGLLECLAGNLISNAIRHNNSGGLIELRTHTALRRAVLSVTNTGPLIPPSEIRQIFQPFYRLPTGRSLSDGAGLGLAIVHAIARAHHAVVTAQPRSGGGLTITIAFKPLA